MLHNQQTMQDARTATTQAKITFQPVFGVNQWERSCVNVLVPVLIPHDDWSFPK